MLVTPIATRSRGKEPGQPGLAEPDHRVRIGVTSQKFQRSVTVIRAEHRIPGRSQQLDQRVEAGVDRGAALDHRGTLLDQPPQRISRALPGVGTQSFGVQQRQPGQQLRVDPVVFGVLGVVLAQVSRLRGRHHHNRRAAPAKPLGNHDPDISGGLEYHRQLSRVLDTHIGPYPLQLVGAGQELPAPPHRLAVTGQRRLMRSPDRDVDPQRQCHRKTLLPQALSDHQVTDRRGYGPDILQAGVHTHRLAPSSRTRTPHDQTPKSTGGRSNLRDHHVSQSDPRTCPWTHTEAKCRTQVR